MKKIFKLSVGFGLLALLLLSFSTAAFAQTSDVHMLQDTPPAYDPGGSGGIQPYGASPPSTSASVQDLSISPYNYQVQKVGVAVFTDKWFHIGTQIDSKTVTISYGTGSCTLSGLDSSTNYYVKFAVPNNGNTYSFNGTISKAS